MRIQNIKENKALKRELFWLRLRIASDIPSLDETASLLSLLKAYKTLKKKTTGFNGQEYESKLKSKLWLYIIKKFPSIRTNFTYRESLEINFYPYHQKTKKAIKSFNKDAIKFLLELQENLTSDGTSLISQGTELFVYFSNLGPSSYASFVIEKTKLVLIEELWPGGHEKRFLRISLEEFYAHLKNIEDHIKEQINKKGKKIARKS